jgi:YfiH family protein
MLDLIKPSIFPNVIAAGITKSNNEKFPPHGFSIFPGDIYTPEETEVYRELLASELNIKRSNIKLQKQVHGSDIIIAYKESPYIEPLPFSDGMITNERRIALIAAVADCAAVMAYDPKNNAIGIFHSGWRGTKENISSKGIEMMDKTFQSNPQDILVYVSPCADGESYEVKEDVAQYFPDAVKKIDDGKYLLDIRKQIKSQMLEAGVPEKNMEISSECTITNKNLHSYRRDKQKSGRMAAFIAII